MIGLVNAAGTPQQARAESVSKSVREQMDDQAKRLAPVLNGEQAASKVLQSAIDALHAMVMPEGERALPTGDQSDRFAQADLESGITPQTVGGNLDVTA